MSQTLCICTGEHPRARRRLEFAPDFFQFPIIDTTFFFEPSPTESNNLEESNEKKKLRKQQDDERDLPSLVCLSDDESSSDESEDEDEDEASKSADAKVDFLSRLRDFQVQFVMCTWRLCTAMSIANTTTPMCLF